MSEPESLFTKTLDFRCSDLGKEATLVLTFNSDDTPGIYKTVFPTALKVTTFLESGNFNFRFVYKSLLGFSRAQVSRGDVVEPPETSIPVGIGQETTLIKKDDAYEFSKPQSITMGTQIVAQNFTGEKQNIGVGFFADTPIDPPLTMLVFKGVGNTSNARIDFIPVLRVFIVTDFKQSEVMKNQVSTPALFNENLAELDDETVWRVTYDKATGEFKIKKDEEKSSPHEVEDEAKQDL